MMRARIVARFDAAAYVGGGEAVAHEVLKDDAILARSRSHRAARLAAAPRCRPRGVPSRSPRAAVLGGDAAPLPRGPGVADPGPYLDARRLGAEHLDRTVRRPPASRSRGAGDVAEDSLGKSPNRRTATVVTPTAENAVPIRPRYGRIGTAFSAVGVTTVAVLAGFGLFPSSATSPAPRDRDRPAAAAPGPVEVLGAEAPGIKVGAGIRNASTPGERRRVTAEDLLPVDSGTGRRVVYSEEQQRVWLLGENGCAPISASSFRTSCATASPPPTTSLSAASKRATIRARIIE